MNNTIDHNGHVSTRPAFQPGDKVRDTESGDLYTVVSSEDELGYVAFTRDVPPVEHTRPQFIEPVEAASVASESTHNAFIAEVLHDEFARLGFKKNMSMAELGSFADEISADPVEIFEAHRFAFGHGSYSPLPVATVADHEPQHSEDELHARLLEWGASERTTVRQLIRLALDTDIDVAELFNAYASLSFIENDGK